MQYFSILASMPAIRLYETPLITVDSFFHACTGVVPEHELQLLRSLSLTPDRKNGQLPFPAGSVAERYTGWETALRWSILKLRAARTGTDIASYGPAEFDSEADHAAAAAYGAANPLDRERILDHARWTKLEELTAQLLHPYQFDGLCAYFLKLLIAWKWAVRKADQSAGNLDQIAAAVQKQQKSDNIE